MIIAIHGGQFLALTKYLQHVLLANETTYIYWTHYEMTYLINCIVAGHSELCQLDFQGISDTS